MKTTDYEKIRSAGASAMADLHALNDEFREFHPKRVGEGSDELNAADELAHWQGELERLEVPAEHWPEWAKADSEGSGE